jgi:predicted RNase H-like HicB family nuclease
MWEALTVKRVGLRVTKDPDDSNVWLVEVDGEPRAHTFGRSLAEAKRHGKELVALWFELEPDQFEIDWNVEHHRC